MKNWGILLLSAVAGLLLTGCYATKTGKKFDARAPQLTNNVALLTNLARVETTNRLSPDWLQVPTNFFRLGPGDRIEIEILSDTNSRAFATVAPDGRLYYSLVPGLDVWGLTLPEAGQALERELARYYTSPQVSMQLRGVDSARVWILGRVANPGVYPMASAMTVLEAIALAGGTLTSSLSGTTEDLADLNHAFIVREGQRLPVNFQRLLHEGDMRQNIYLAPDDFIYFPSAAVRDIYVLGAVRSPKAVNRQHDTLVGAIADAGGPIKNAYLSHVAIVRGTLDDPQIAVVNFNEIVVGKAPDVQLEPRDIVYVPFSPYRFLTKYLDLILTTFVRAVAINEGARAAEPSATPAGVSIGITGGTGTLITPGVVPGAGTGTGNVR
jgi:polysaccharide biosynthesis/export protein